MKATLTSIADELDDAVGNILLKDIHTQELYRLLMAAQSAIAAMRIVSANLKD